MVGLTIIHLFWLLFFPLGPDGLPSYNSRAECELPAWFISRNPATLILHSILTPGNVLFLHFQFKFINRFLCLQISNRSYVWKIWFIYNTSENTVLTIALPAIREKRLYWVQIILFWCEIDRLEDSLLDVDWFEMVRNTSIKWVDSSNQQLWGFISQKPSWLLNILLQYGTRIKSELNNNEKSIIRH